MSDVLALINDAVNNVLGLALWLWAGIILVALVLTGLARLRPQRTQNGEWWPWMDEENR
jgi:hypothetical protein